MKGHDTKKKPLSDYALKEVPALSRGTGVSDGVVSDVEKAALIVREETDADEQTSEAAGQLIDNAEVDLLARLIYVEVGDSSKDAQIAAASVILNRVQSEKYPNSISEVIYQPGQYPSISGGAFNGAPSEQALESARYVYQNGSQIPANVLYQSRDAQGSGVWAEYDGEYFCYE